MLEPISRRLFLGTTLGASLGLAWGLRAADGQPLEGAPGRLLHRFDCTADYPPDQFFSTDNVQVVEGLAGRYREAEAKPLSRFGYRFQIENVGKPHVALIRFPDDKRRFMCLMDGTTYDLTTGIFTNWAQPLSGTMLEIEQVFWPRWRDCSLVFITWSEGEPAAAASIEIWELDNLPPLDLPPAPTQEGRRQIGIQYEDPCGTGSSEGAMGHTEWASHVIEYMHHTGQTLLAYPLAWYHGPMFPSEHEPSGAIETVVTPDRKQYVHWSSQPADWYADLLQRFDEEGLEFQGSMTLMRLGSLMEKMNNDLASIQAGAETYNNMIWNNHVQEGTRDWTGLYNVKNFTAIAKVLESRDYVEPYSGVIPGIAYGELSNPAYHTAPMFNPLHPTVEAAILRFVREIGERYGKFHSFKGISFNMFASSMPWFGSIHSGYDDYTIHLFQEETGIEVPGDLKSPERFSERYQFLSFVCRPAWISWRCHKIRALFSRIHETLASTRPDLRVTVTLWDETAIPNTLGSASTPHQTGARMSNYEFYREAGIDMALYGDEPGLEVDLAMGNSRDRGGHGANPAAGITAPLSSLTMFRDFDFLDQDTLAAAHAHSHPGVFIFNCWVEAWGKHIWFKPEADDPNLPQIKVMDGKPVDGIMRINSEYPKDGFWWNSQLRITPPFPAGPHFLEPYAHALAELDACRMTRGGLFLDKAHSQAIRGFARAYQTLPDVKFDMVGSTTDPVAIRKLHRNDKLSFYMINREYYPIEVDVHFTSEPGTIQDLATGETLSASTSWKVELGPYELRSFAASAKVDLAEFTPTPPPEIVKALQEEAQKALASITHVREAGKFIPGMDEIEARLQTALAKGHLALLRRLITGYVVRKCEELSA